ncbi:MAG TPA: hypothetical protein VL403_17805, partial [Candidatus Kryptonia bacterium]|nr:hypothetical protein [Candidatus Kryptonia bacterium]
FPAVYAIVGVLLAGIVRLVRARAAPWLAAVTATALAVVVAGVVGTSLTSHFLVGTGPIAYGSAMRFAKPLFQQSNLILHNLDPGPGRTVLFGNLDELLASDVCYHYVAEDEWLAAALEPRCAFNEYGYTLTMPPERIAEVKAKYQPQRISYLLEDSTYNRAHVDLLRSLHPTIELRHEGNLPNRRNLLSMTVDAADVTALHRPALFDSSESSTIKELDAGLLDGVRLSRVPSSPESPPGSELAVRGGLIILKNGWYGFQIEPECAGVRLSVDQKPAASEGVQPMLAGVHPFELTLPDVNACRLPLALSMRADDRAPVRIDAQFFVSPVVASAPSVQASPVTPYPGFGEAHPFALLSGGPIDLGVDGQGFVSVFVVEQGVGRVQRFDPAGHEVARWSPALPPGRVVHSMAVEPDGTIIFVTDNIVSVVDQAGKPIATWHSEWGAGASDIAAVPDGRVLLTVPTRNSVAVFTRDGKLQGEIKEFDGGPGHFVQPGAVALGPDGRMVVIEDDGRVLVFRTSGDLLKPAFVATFRADFSGVPWYARGLTFDGPDRILIPDPYKPPLAYGIDGQRLMASLSARDLGVLGIGAVVRLRFAGDRLYALDGFRNRIWLITR